MRRGTWEFRFHLSEQAHIQVKTSSPASAGDALPNDLGSLYQLLRHQPLDNSLGFFHGCLSVLRGMDRFQHPGHAFDLAFGNNGRHIVVKMQNTLADPARRAASPELVSPFWGPPGQPWLEFRRAARFLFIIRSFLFVLTRDLTRCSFFRDRRRFLKISKPIIFGRGEAI